MATRRPIVAASGLMQEMPAGDTLPIGVLPTGTSGNAVPMLDGANAWSANQAFNGGAQTTQITTGTTLSDKFMTYGSAGVAGSFGIGVEAGAQTYKANSIHYFYCGANADGGASAYFKIDTTGAYVGLAKNRVLTTADQPVNATPFQVGHVGPMYNGGSTVSAGATTAGSNLSVPKWTTSGPAGSGNTQSGTWQALGDSVLNGQAGIFKRTA